MLLIYCIKALQKNHPARQLRIIASAIEHSSVTATLEQLKEEGVAIDAILPDGNGCIRTEDVAAAITPDTAIICIMWANNVLGTLQPIAELGKIIAAEKNKLMKYLQGKLAQHADYIVKNGHDMMEIEQWQWSGNRK